MSTYQFSPSALLLGANCRQISFTAEHAVFISRTHQIHEYRWDTLEPQIKHYRGAVFDTLILNWQQQRIRLNGIEKNKVSDLLTSIYTGALLFRQNEIINLHKDLSHVLSSGFVSHYQWLKVKSMLLPLAEWLDNLDKIVFIPEVLRDPLTRLAFWHHSKQSTREKYNLTVAEQHKNQFKPLFDTLEAHPMTNAQRDACVVNDNANLVLAGAGCGKTSVMLGRCAFLLESKQAAASDILILAFAKDAASEMAGRLDDKLKDCQVNVSTFHSLGLEIIKQVEGKRPKITSLATSERSKTTYFTTQLKSLRENKAFEQLFTGYCVNFLAWSNHESDDDLEKVLAEKGLYKSLVKNLIDLVMQYKLLRSRSIEQSRSIDKQISYFHRSHLVRQSAQIVQTLLDLYEQKLIDDNEIDFDDMISLATHYVQEGQFKSSWTHILVDEFQDISPQRATLIKALCDQQADSKLFCVGDDWQAIYQFAGSDINLTTDFKSYFGIATQLPLDKTFRFNDQISAVASRFVMQNERQIQKVIQTNSKVKSASVYIDFYDVDKPLTKKQDSNLIFSGALLDAKLAALQSSAQKSSKSVLILARFSYQLPSKKDLTQFAEQYTALDINAMTVHSSKGQEADEVILLGMQQGEFGFPSEKARFPLLAILQPNTEAYDFAEERRLFYVALTRAKHLVHIFCHRTEPSVFITELIEQDYPVKIID